MNELTWGAVKLPLQYDADKLAEEVMDIASEKWGINGRTAPAFADTQAIFLKGYAAAEGKSSVEDRELLSRLPYIKNMIYNLVPSVPQNCVLSYLPPNTDVGLHVDQGEYFKNTLRIHFPVITNDKITMYFGGSYTMKPGEVWLLNNCAPHGVENAHNTDARIHLICDYLPSAELDELFNQSDKHLGKTSQQLHEKLLEKTRINFMKKQGLV